MITLAEYVGPHKDSPDWNVIRQANARALLLAVSKLMRMAMDDGVNFQVNPKTGTCVSGETFGGFRPQSCPIGAARSSHKEGLAVDIYDPKGEIDTWCLANLDKLEDCGIYIEHPSKTIHWSHWTIKPPGSGKRVFYP